MKKVFLDAGDRLVAYDLATGEIVMEGGPVPAGPLNTRNADLVEAAFCEQLRAAGYEVASPEEQWRALMKFGAR